VSLAALAVMLAWMFERRPLARVALVASTIPIAVLMNGLRIAATGVAVEQWGPALGKGTWHEFTGWVTFVVSLAVLFAVQRALGEPRPHDADGTPTDAREGLATA
jgi:exosortase/archaeosortase family protein